FTFSNTLLISGFTPLSGAGGTVVTITGANFNPVAANNIVYFGENRANVTAATPGSLTVVAPAGASYKPISITSGGLTAFSRLSFTSTFAGGGQNFSLNSFA